MARAKKRTPRVEEVRPYVEGRAGGRAAAPRLEAFRLRRQAAATGQRRRRPTA